MGQELATEGHPLFATIAPHQDELDKQSEKIAVESIRLQNFLHSLGPQRTDAADTVGAFPHSTPSPADTVKRGKYKIVCTLDGKEPAVVLYEKYAELEHRIFLNGRHAIPIHEYLSRRARGIHWELEPPTYEIVPVEE
jgi:hypothetical protein